MKSVFFIFLLVLFLLSPVSGADLKVDVTKEQNFAEPGGSINLIITIKNERLRDDTFELKVDDFAVAPFSDAIESVAFSPSNTIIVPSRQQLIVTAKVIFLKTVRPGRNYILPLEVKSLSDPNVREVLDPLIYVISPQDVINIEIIPPTDFIPGKSNIVTLKLKNNVNVNINNARIFYTSPVFNFEDSLSLKPLGEKNIELPLNLDPDTLQGDYSMTIRIFKDNTLKGSAGFTFVVGENPDVVEKKNVATGFLYSRIGIERKNNGNVAVERTVTYPVTFLKDIFTSTQPKAGIILSDGKRYYQWKFTIQPGATQNIKIVTDYRWIFFSIVVILLAVYIIIYVRKRELGLIKEVLKISEDKFSSLKVILHITNRSPRTFYTVKVMDFVPHYGHMEIEYGTFKPGKVEESGNGRRLVWEIPKIEPREERIISYILKSKVIFVSRYKLPRALLRYYGKKKRIMLVKSHRQRF